MNNHYGSCYKENEMSTESFGTIDDIIRLVNEEGWVLRKGHEDTLFVSPPKGDERTDKNWAANYQPFNVKLLLPNWHARKPIKDTLVCEDCGINSDLDDTVQETYCPIEEEINGQEVAVTLCSGCIELRNDEV
jgi:hypothetical protein